MPSLAVIVVLALATYRLTRLVVVDSISEPLRSRLFFFAYDAEHPVLIDGQSVAATRAPWRTWLYQLFDCSHCFGVWAGIAVYCAWRWGGDVALAILAVAALCGAQSIAASFVNAVEE